MASSPSFTRGATGGAPDEDDGVAVATAARVVGGGAGRLATADGGVGGGTGPQQLE
jgi:hypothetical protein